MITFRAVVWFFLRREFRTPWLWIVVAAVLTLSTLTVTLGLRDLDARRAQYARGLQQLIQDQVRPSLGFTGWQIEPALRALRPPSTGTAIARGIDTLIPAYSDFGPAGKVPSPVTWTQGLDAGAGPALDVEFIVRVITGLLAIFLGVRATASDREAGLTRALAGLPVRPSTLLLGSLAAASALLIAGLGLGACCVVATTAVETRAPNIVGEIRAELAAAAPVAIAYLFFLLTLGALIGTLVRREAAAYATAFTVWFTVAVLTPQLLTLAIRILIPLQSQGAMLAERDEAFADRIREGESALGQTVARDAAARTTAMYSASIAANAPQLDTEWRQIAATARGDARRIESAWMETFLERQRVTRWGEWLSPASSFSGAMANVAHTGWLVESEWERMTSDYQSVLERDLFDDRPNVTIRATSDSGVELFQFHRRPAPKLANLPLFRLPALDAPVLPGVTWIAARLLLESIAALCLTVWLSQRSRLAEAGATRPTNRPRLA